MSDESGAPAPVRSTVMEIGEMKAKKRRGTILIVSIIVVSVIVIVVAYFVLKPTPFEVVAGDMCGFADMTGTACPTLEKAMTEMGADEAWCENVIKGKEGLEPDQFSGVYLGALRTLLDENIDRLDKAGTPVPAEILAVQEKVDPSGAAERRAAMDAEKAPPSPTPATDGGAADGSAGDGG